MDFQSSASSPSGLFFRKDLMGKICVFFIYFSIFRMFNNLTMYIVIPQRYFEGYWMGFQSSATSK